MFHSRDTNRYLAIACAVAACALLASPSGAWGETPLLERDVLPILTKNCMGCHGGIHQEGELDLRTVPAMLTGGESGPAIVAGHAQQSELWLKIESDEMPSGEKQKLSPQEKALIKQWIDSGLPTVAQSQTGADTRLPPNKRHQPSEVARAIEEHVE